MLASMLGAASCLIVTLAAPASAASEFDGFIRVGAFDAEMIDMAKRRFERPDYLVIPRECNSSPVTYCMYAALGDVLIAAIGDSERSRTREVRLACKMEKPDEFCQLAIEIVMAMLDPEISAQRRLNDMQNLFSQLKKGDRLPWVGGMTAAYYLEKFEGGFRLVAVPRQ